jgi:hypothetical protein
MLGDKRVRTTLVSVTPILTSSSDTERNMIGLQVDALFQGFHAYKSL